CDCAQDVGSGQAPHHVFDCTGDLAGGADGFRPERGETLHAFVPGVEHDETVARLDQPAGHGEAHLPESNEADIHRRPSLDCAVLVACQIYHEGAVAPM